MKSIKGHIVDVVRREIFDGELVIRSDAMRIAGKRKALVLHHAGLH